jgi:hypothetical protein
MSKPDRVPFGTLVRTAIRNRFRESRAPEAVWQGGSNLGWVRWACEDGRYFYCGIRRKNGWITGELGIASEPLELDELKLIQALTPSAGDAFRIQLGMLLHGQEKWWSFGGTEKGLNERMDWIAQQLQMRMYSFLSSSSVPPQA